GAHVRIVEAGTRNVTHAVRIQVGGAEVVAAAEVVGSAKVVGPTKLRRRHHRPSREARGGARAGDRLPRDLSGTVIPFLRRTRGRVATRHWSTVLATAHDECGHDR